jgi:hypothetical protein
MIFNFRRRKVMRIDFDRICKLAGVTSNSSKTLMREGNYRNEMGDYSEAYGSDHSAMEEEIEGADEGVVYEDDLPGDASEDADEMVDVDVSELMSEIRRAKKIMKMNESRKRRDSLKQRRLQENHLKRIIQKEVDNILSEIEDKDSSWVYGNRKPKYSRDGYSNQGRTLPGIGFGKKW